MREYAHFLMHMIVILFATLSTLKEYLLIKLEFDILEQAKELK